ncbi:MAG: hypothetical protein ACKVHP_25570 [Verrucomicrobiales bacterium]
MTRIFARWRWGLFVGGAIFGLFVWFLQEKGSPSPFLFLIGLAIVAVTFLLVATDVAS